MTLTLRNLIELQLDLNEHAHRYSKRDELTWAIAAGLGEFANSRKSVWAWWIDKSIESEGRDRQLDKAADAIGLFLVGMIQRFEPKGLSDAILRNDMVGLSNACNYDSKNIRTVLLFVSTEQYFLGLAHFVSVLLSHGYLADEIESAYLRKIDRTRNPGLNPTQV